MLTILNIYLHQMTKLRLLFAVLLTTIPLHAQVATIQPGDSVEFVLRGVPASDSQLINGVYSVDRSGRIIGLPFLDKETIGTYDLRFDEGKREKLLPYDTVLVDEKTILEP